MNGIPLFDLDVQIYGFLKNTEPLSILPETSEALLNYIKKTSESHSTALDPALPGYDSSAIVASELKDVHNKALPK